MAAISPSPHCYTGGKVVLSENQEEYSHLDGVWITVYGIRRDNLVLAANRKLMEDVRFRLRLEREEATMVGRMNPEETSVKPRANKVS